MAIPGCPFPTTTSPTASPPRKPIPNSVLQFTRRIIAWRKAHTAMMRGRIRFRRVEERQVSFLRQSDTETLLIAVNLVDEAVRLPWDGPDLVPLKEVSAGAATDGDGFTLQPFGMLAAKVNGDPEGDPS